MARRALTIQFKLVSGDVEFMSACDLLLEFLDITILELDNRATLCADHVIVVSLVGHVVEVCLGPEMPLLRQSTLAKKIQCAVDGCESDMRCTLRKFVVDLLRGDMFHLEKGLKNNLTLAGHSKLMLGEMLAKDGYLVSYGFFYRVSCHSGASLILIMNLFIIPLADIRQGMIVESAFIYGIPGRSWLSATALTLA